MTLLPPLPALANETAADEVTVCCGVTSTRVASALRMIWAASSVLRSPRRACMMVLVLSTDHLRELAIRVKRRCYPVRAILDFQRPDIRLGKARIRQDAIEPRQIRFHLAE